MNGSLAEGNFSCQKSPETNGEGMLIVSTRTSGVIVGFPMTVIVELGVENVRESTDGVIDTSTATDSAGSEKVIASTLGDTVTKICASTVGVSKLNVATSGEGETLAS